MNARYRRRERVGGMIWRGNRRQAQKEANRFLNDFLVGAAGTGNSLLDLVGRVFAERKAAQTERESDDSAGFGNGKGARDVFGEIKGFHSRFLRFPRVKDFDEGFVYSDKPGLMIELRARLDDTVTQMRETISGGKDYAPPCRSQARIDADDQTVGFVLQK